MSSRTAELVRELIRNECVNDGSLASGFEKRNAELLESVFFRSHAEIQMVGKIDSRSSLVVRIQGRNPNAPKVLLLPHTDVVPFNAADWDFDPVGGDIYDGFVHGRGAVDMFNVTAAMAVALSDVMGEGYVPEGDVTYVAVADEENGGTLGAEYLYGAYPELMRADYVLGETGGVQMPVGEEIFIPIATGEKGVHWIEIDVKGTPGHGSKPLGADNSNLTALRVIEAFEAHRSPVKFSDSWSAFLEAVGINKDLIVRIKNEDTIREALDEVDQPLRAVLHACTHHTVSPNIIHGGVKINTVADSTMIGFDIRSLPGTTLAEVEQIISDILGPFGEKVSKPRYKQHVQASSSPTNTPMWHLLQQAAGNHVEGARLIEVDAPYGTDIRFGRNGEPTAVATQPAVGYGAALFAPDTTYADHLAMFHGINERVSIDSLELTVAFYRDILRGVEHGL